MADCMTFPKTFDEFAERYKIVDKKEVYTNGTELIPIFRVEQWIEHLEDERDRYKRYYFNHEYDKMEANIRADTVRKMQERLDKHFCHDPAFLGVEQRLIMDVIDQIAKEMVEGIE